MLDHTEWIENKENSLLASTNLDRIASNEKHDTPRQDGWRRWIKTDGGDGILVLISQRRIFKFRSNSRFHSSRLMQFIPSLSLSLSRIVSPRGSVPKLALFSNGQRNRSIVTNQNLLHLILNNPATVNRIPNFSHIFGSPSQLRPSASPIIGEQPHHSQSYSTCDALPS